MSSNRNTKADNAEHDIHPLLLQYPDLFPYETSVSFEPLATYLSAMAKGKKGKRYDQYRDIVKQLKSQPLLLGMIKDPAVLNKHDDIVRYALSAVIPSALSHNKLVMASRPFALEPIYQTDIVEQIMGAWGVANLSKIQAADAQSIFNMRVINGCLHILSSLYGRTFPEERQLTVDLTDPKTKLDSHYKASVFPDYVNVQPRKKLRKINDKIINQLFNNIYDIEQWLYYFPPEDFHFYGVAVVELLDVTSEQIISSLKYDLLEQDAITTKAGIKLLQNKLRSLFRMPELQLGIAAFNPSMDSIISYRSKIWNSFVLNEDFEVKKEYFQGSMYEKMKQQGSPIIIEDLEAYGAPTKMEQILLEKGIKNIVIAPLFYNNEFTGVLELATDKPGLLNAMNMIKLHELTPLFSTAARRSIDEMQNRIQAAIKEKCTAIHPTVEWRFVHAAANMLEQHDLGDAVGMEPIVFKDVYPMYGQTDVRHSSTTRNRAIQDDLIENLELAHHVVTTALQLQSLPILDEIDFRIGKMLKKIAKDLDTGDEVTIREFIKEEIEPIFKNLDTGHEKLKAALDQYNEAMDDEHGLLYQRRKDFEDSIMIINERVSSFLEEEQVKAQQMFPHYFEKYKTDGVEYNAYIGASLVQGEEFNEFFLRNFRLWQLLNMCEITRITHELKPLLNMPLETTQLILVYGSPLSIHFRMDEKKFDVEGAYNMRYEIVKKRIDKAYIKGTTERLTQPGKIAIVFSQPRDEEEYMKYIEYLQHKNYLDKNAEVLELQDLQGMHGMRAIRVTVNIVGAHDLKEDLEKDRIEAALKEIEESTN